MSHSNTHENSIETTGCVAEPICSTFRILLIAGLSLGVGIATNGLLNANSNESYTGQMQVQTLLVRAPVDGILQSWHVSEGETVDPNVLLCQIGGHNLARQIQLQQQEVARLEARTATLQAEMDVKLHDHLRELENDIYQAELQTADLLQKKYYYELEVIAWRDMLNSYKETGEDNTTTTSRSGQDSLLADDKLASDKLTDRQINALMKEESSSNSLEATVAQLEICTQRLNKLKQQKQAMHNRVRLAVGLEEVELQLSQAKDELAHLQKHQEEQNIRSTTIGTIANFRKRPGEYVQAGEVLADMYQLSESFVMADIPSSVSHRFSVDTTVKCKFPNGETRSGVVTRVAVATSPGQTANRNETPTVPLKIEPTGALWPSMPVGGHVTIIR